MADIFKRTELQFGGAYAADRGLIVPQPSKGLTGLLMQNIGLNYSQNVTRIYDLGDSGQATHIFYIGGRSQGSLAAAHVIGPKLSMKCFYSAFSDVCQARNNDLRLSINNPNDGCDTVSLQYTAKFCVLVGVGMAVAAQDFVINENSQLMFSNLTYDENGLTDANACAIAGDPALATRAGKAVI